MHMKYCLHDTISFARGLVVTFGEYFRGKGASPINQCCQKIRVIALSCGIKISAMRHLVLTIHASDGRTDGQNCASNTVRCITCSRTVKATDLDRTKLCHPVKERTRPIPYCHSEVNPSKGRVVNCYKACMCLGHPGLNKTVDHDSLFALYHIVYFRLYVFVYMSRGMRSCNKKKLGYRRDSARCR